MRFILFTLLLIANLNVFACTVPPRTLLQSDEDLVSRSPNIALAKAQRQGNSDNNYVKFAFNTVETIKGKVPKEFYLEGFSAKETEDSPGDFSGHKMPEFWAFSAGNSILPGDCNAYGLFEIGKTYLIFYGGPTHVRSFEQISSKDDVWLNVVKLLIEREEHWKN